MTNIDDFMDSEPEEKKESIMGFLLALIIGTVAAAGTGWFLGGQFIIPEEDIKMEVSQKDAGKTEAKEEKAEEKADKQEQNAENTKDEGVLLPLEPILVVLDGSENTYLRLELALILNKEAETVSSEGKAKLQSDLLAFARTISLSQIAGPSGYLHLRDDLIDRARLITDGGVEDILILSMVAE